MSQPPAARAGQRLTHPRLIQRGDRAAEPRAATTSGRDEDVTSIWRLVDHATVTSAELDPPRHERDDTEVDGPLHRPAPPPVPVRRRAPRGTGTMPATPWSASEPPPRSSADLAGGQATFGAAAAWAFDDDGRFGDVAVPGLARLPVRPSPRPALPSPRPVAHPVAPFLAKAEPWKVLSSPMPALPDLPAVPVALGSTPAMPRARTAIEPARAPRPVVVARRRPTRAIAIALATSVLVAAAAALVLEPTLFRREAMAARQIAIALGPGDAGDERVLAERLARVAVAPLDSTRAFHARTASFRDRWRDSTWFHPLTGEELLPHSVARKFGARRPGKRPTECGRGHCGVDLGDFGMQVSAAQGGVIERVARRDRDRAGKYVRIAHDDGFVSYYIHLHRIRADLEVGMRIEAGEPIGVVGRTGIKRSPPHLHFALAYREAGKLYFVDPEPMLRHSKTQVDDAEELDTWAANQKVEAATPTTVHVR